MAELTSSQMGKRSWEVRRSPEELQRLKEISKLPRKKRTKNVILGTD